MYLSLGTFLALLCCSGVVTAYRSESHGKSFGFDEGVRNHFSPYDHDVDTEWVKPPNPFVIPKYVIQPKQDYSYVNQGGARRWSEVFPECGGERQSPISIDSDLISRKHFKPLVFRDFWDNANTAVLNNTGKYAKVTLEGNFTLPTISGGPFSGEYTFSQLHYHWGANDYEGSEHTVDDETFSMEAHVVHFKSSYGTLTEAANHEDGLAVIAFFVDAFKHNHNAAFNDFAVHLKKVKKALATVKLPSASKGFSWFKKHIWGDYVTYSGSLTTPPCSEIVTWLIYTKPRLVSSEQVDEFRALRNTDGTKIKINYRPVQRFIVPDLYGPRH